MTKCVLPVIAVLSLCFQPGCSDAPSKKSPQEIYPLRLKVGDRELKTLVAYTDAARKVGLMNRDTLGEDVGMLFIYAVAPKDEKLGFWMKNTRIPLSIAFIDDLGEVKQIEDMKAYNLTTVRSRYDVRYALEVAKGWYEKAGLKVGDLLPDFPSKVSPFLKAAE